MKLKSNKVFFFEIMFSFDVVPVKRLFLGGNFDDARLVDDACSTVSFLDNANDPSLISLLLLDVLAVSGRLFARQADEKSSGCFRRMSLKQLEHVAAGFRNCSHFRDDWQVMDHKGDFVLLVRRERLSMAQESEAGDVSRAVRVVFMHETRGGAVQASHRVHRSVICFSDVFFRHDQLELRFNVRLRS